MNRWVRIGLIILAMVILLQVGLGVLVLGLRLISAFFPLLMLIGVGLILYGLIQHWRHRLKRREHAYHDLLED